MPKRKAASKISGLVGSDDEDLLPPLTEIESVPAKRSRDEPPAKKRRGRPRISHDDENESNAPPQAKNQSSAAASQTQTTEAKQPGRRGRPRGGSRASADPEPRTGIAVTNKRGNDDDDTHEQENEDPVASKDVKAPATARAGRPAATRGRGRGRAANAAKRIPADGEFEFTPTRSHKIASQEQSKEPVQAISRPRAAGRQNREHEVDEEEPETEMVDETIMPEEPASVQEAKTSPVKNIRARIAALRSAQDASPRKRRLGATDSEQNAGDPELRRRLGDLTKKHDALEAKYRSLREIGIVEANSNMEKLRKQCESITVASNELVASLKSEVEAQRLLGQQSRGLQKQLKERDTEISQLKSQASEAREQLSSAQSEIRALQTKLAAARNTAASLESVAKAPGSVIKGGGANRGHVAASAEATQAAQIAQLKEDLYSDLSGLIIRDVKTRETDYLYDCIQTGINGTLHFKLAIPKVSSAEYESAEFQYLPLLDANRDRDLVNTLPDFLTVDITFNRQQACKFYTRVIDALTKRRTSSAQ